MSSKQWLYLIFGCSVTFSAMAIPPVEVISSCVKGHNVRDTVTYTALPPAVGSESAVAGGCNNPDDHIEETEGGLTYGAVVCDAGSYIIVNSNKVKLKDAENYSVNPAVGPGGMIEVTTNSWAKITFDNIDYLCVMSSLSNSGKAASIYNYYIIENAYNSQTPIAYYYMFDKRIMPMDES